MTIKKRAKAQKRVDGWSNILTNLGMANKDKRTGASVTASFLTQSQIENFYSGDDVAARIIDRLPEEMTREGFKVYSEDFPDLCEQVQDIFERYGLDQKIESGLKWARLYGGAGMIVGAKDGLLSGRPLSIKTLNDIEYWTVLHRYQLLPWNSSNLDVNLGSPNFGLPNYYRIQMDGNSLPVEYNNLKIHHSRIIRFEGCYVPSRLKSQVEYWGDSILGRLYNVIRNYQSANDSCALIMQDMTQLIIKLKNLADMMASGDDDLVTKRLSLLATTASIINAVVVEEGEEVERKTTNLSGIPELLGKVNSRLVAATDYPHTILLGESPSGLGATGESEKRDWYDHVKNQQESILRPVLKKILNLIFASKNGPTKGVIPKKFTIEFNPLWQPSEKETAETRKITAETDAIYMDHGVLDAEDVAENRFGSGKYSMETIVDLESRAKVAEAEPDEEYLKTEGQAVQ